MIFSSELKRKPPGQERSGTAPVYLQSRHAHLRSIATHTQRSRPGHFAGTPAPHAPSGDPERSNLITVVLYASKPVGRTKIVSGRLSKFSEISSRRHSGLEQIQSPMYVRRPEARPVARTRTSAWSLMPRSALNRERVLPGNGPPALHWP